MTDADCADDLALPVNTSAQTESLLCSLKQAAGDIGLHVNANKTEFMHFKQKGAIFIFSLSGKLLKLVDHLHSKAAISHLQKAMSISVAKWWTAIDWLSNT